MTTRAQTKSAGLPVVLRSRHRWLRWRGTLVVGILGLAATLVAVQLLRASWPAREIAELWGGGVLLTVIAAVIAGRFAPSSLLVTARNLDGRFAGKGRLEAAAVLKDSTSPLAVAQREETTLYLASETQARKVRALPWLTTIFVALILAHLAMLALWLRPVSIPLASLALTPSPAALPPETPPPAQAAESSSITWKSPEQATEANPVEDVPATATINSPAGLKDLTLDVSVNGKIVKSTPLPADAANTAGSHDVKVSLSLDDLKVQPFDVVSYDLHGKDTATAAETEVTSPEQFVQVRPFRQPATASSLPASAPNDLARSQAAQLLNQLELAQLQSISDNFALTHDHRPASDPVRAQETQRVGKEQSELSAKTEEVAKALDAAHLPSDASNNLHQAEPQMADSGKKILADQNSDAIVAQEKALELISQAEKTAYQAPSANPAAIANTSDAVEDSPPHALAPRSQTLLGQLETLEKNQTQLAGDLTKSPDDSTATIQPGSTPVTLPTPAPAPPPNPPPANGMAPAPAPTASAPTQPPAPATEAAPTAPPPVDPFGPDADKGSFAERQEHVEQGINALQASNKIQANAAKAALTAAEKQAGDSLRQLSTEQQAAALEPAAAAAINLQQTVKALNQAGDAATRQELAETQQKLNELASELRGVAQSHPADATPHLSALAHEVHDAQQALQTAADQQQDSGSAEGAAQLNQLASSIHEKRIASDLAAMSKSGLDANRASAQADALESLARQAASELAPASTASAQNYADLAGALKRSDANLAHLADKALQDGAATQVSSQANRQTGSTPGQPGSPPPGQQASSQPSGLPPPAPAGGNQLGQNPAQAQPSDITGAAFHEALQDLKNQTQQTAKIVPNADASAVDEMILRYDKDTSYRAVTGADVVRFHTDLQKPLEKLIVDVQALQDHAPREDIVKAPDLDETPALYRPAVSKYFEDLSHDYHSPAPPAPAKP